MLLAVLFAAASVVTADLTLHDAARNKDVEVRVVHPTEGQALPAIVFSHGAGGSREGCSALAEVWASHGYVVVCPTHADSLQARHRRGERPRPGQALPRPLEGDAQAIQERVRDLRFVIDQLAGLPKQVPALAGRIDAGRVGVAGHSLGALTAMLLAGLRPTTGQDLADPRPRAFLLLSPQGRGGALGDESWKGMTRPAMFVTGSGDVGRDGQDASWRKEGYERAPAGDKYLVFIQGATHLSFVGKLGEEFERLAEHAAGSRSPAAKLLAKPDPAEQEAIWTAIRRASLAFWDGLLKDDPRGKAYLASDELAKDGRSTLSRK